MTLNDLIARDLYLDEEDALRREEAQAERQADALAASYDPTFACVECSAVMAEPHAALCPLDTDRCPGCPWCSPEATGPAIMALFAAAPTMKALYLAARLKLSRAGDRSSNPGGLWIAQQGEDGLYFGSIRADGTMRMTRAWTAALPHSGSDQLKRLAAFGTEEIARVGLQTGRCCYCWRLLTDPVSVALGYGPVCAGYHGLPHSKEAAGLVDTDASIPGDAEMDAELERQSERAYWGEPVSLAPVPNQEARTTRASASL